MTKCFPLILASCHQPHEKKKVFLMKILLSFYSSQLAHIGKSMLSNIAILKIYHRFMPDRRKKKELCSISIKNAKDYE